MPRELKQTVLFISQSSSSNFALSNDYLLYTNLYVTQYFQVYNETIRDLLSPGKALALREDPQKGVCVNNITLHQVTALIKRRISKLTSAFLDKI